MKTSVLLTMLFALASTSQVHAADKAPPAAYDPAAVMLVDILASTCIDYADRPAILKVWLDTHLEPAPAASEKSLIGEKSPGRAWLVKDDTGSYAVIVHDNGMCDVKAAHANIEDAFRYFEAVAAAKHDLKSETVKDEKKAVTDKMTVYKRLYKVTATRTATSYTLSGMGTNAILPIQAQFSFGPYQPPQKP